LFTAVADDTDFFEVSCHAVHDAVDGEACGAAERVFFTACAEGRESDAGQFHFFGHLHGPPVTADQVAIFEIERIFPIRGDGEKDVGNRDIIGRNLKNIPRAGFIDVFDDKIVKLLSGGANQGLIQASIHL